MTTKRWRLIVNPLSGATPLHQLEVDASNWVGALRTARQELGEEGGVPPGASCAVAPDGTVTILDSASRRKFLLTPLTSSLPPPSDPPAAQAANAVVVQPVPSAQPVAIAAAAPVAATPGADAPAPSKPAKKAKFQTVAYTPGMPLPGTPVAAVQPSASVVAQQPVAVVAQPAATQPAAAVSAALAQPAAAQAAAPAQAAEPPGKKKKKFETVAFSPDETRKVMASINVGGQEPAAAAAPARAVSRPVSQPSLRSSQPSPPTAAPLELLFTRDEDPGAQNPLTYRERAYLIPRGMTVTEAEAALRFVLADLQRQIEGAARGKFVNLAAFDHRWSNGPERPPLIVLEWRDWRGEPAVDYPAAARDDGDHDDRLALVFEELHELPHLRTAAEGLDFVIRLLAQTVPTAAASACLYDINTDELRFVAATGPGADALRGTAISRSLGLLGHACHIEGRPLVVSDVRAHPNYNAASDAREGLEVSDMLLRAVVREGHLLGLLQLVNRQTGAFSSNDVAVVNYVAEQLAEFLHSVRVRPS